MKQTTNETLNISQKKVTVTYSTDREEGLQTKEFDSEQAYNAWSNTMAGIVTVILVARRDN